MICCHEGSIPIEGNSNTAGRFGSLSGCDIPFITIESFIKYGAELNPDFIIYMGDNPDHDIFNQTYENHLRSLKDFTKLLKDNYKGTVYPILGNHEGFPCDTYNVEGHDHDWIVEESMEAWGDWLDEDMKKTFKEIGCYSTLFKNSNLRIITLNSFVQLSTNHLIWENQTDLLGTVLNILNFS